VLRRLRDSTKRKKHNNREGQRERDRKIEKEKAYANVHIIACDMQLSIKYHVI